MKKISVALFIIIGYATHAQPISSADFHYPPPLFLEDGINVGSMKSAGIDSARIIALTKLILADSFPNIHSLLIFKDNQLVYENYFPGKDQISGKNLGYITH